jgi:osmotically-inducible protein OsmY
MQQKSVTARFAALFPKATHQGLPMNKKLLIAASVAAVLFAGVASAEDTVEQNLAEANKEGRIWSSFALNPHINAYQIDVDVEGETATLSGTVDEPAARDLAAMLAMDVSGVKDVVNNIKVDYSYRTPPRKAGDHDFAMSANDATITARVKSKLLWNTQTDGLEINVDTKDAHVTLSGTADTDEAKAKATRLAANTSGVHSVDNNLVVEKGYARKPSSDPIEDSWITTKVKSSLLFSQHVDGLDINVDTKDGVVTLSGVVGPSEKALAVELAENVRGVKSVSSSGLTVSAVAATDDE